MQRGTTAIGKAAFDRKNFLDVSGGVESAPKKSRESDDVHKTIQKIG
jgi:hypothetical protein